MGRRTLGNAFTVATLLALAACGGGGGTDGGTPDAGSPDAGPPRCTMDTQCDDGLFCNGPERCVPTSASADARGCVITMSSPCLSIQTCNEAMGRCVTDCAVMGGDADGDGHRALECGGDDCNDGDPNAYPGNPEVCDPLDHDEDCNPATYGERDQDRDTFADATCCNVNATGTRACGTDCADLAASVHPGATEACNGFDDDCNGMVDEGVTVPGFADMDGDLHGDPMAARMACAGAAHFSTTNDDCNDHDVRINGGQVEVCDGLDNNCNGMIDDDTRPVTWYADTDGDGFGNAHGGTMTACAPPPGYSLLPIDCDDSAMGVNPAATEQCNGRDDDCNGRADYVIHPNDFEDDDADGAVDLGCGGAGTDCDDGDATVHRGADPVCDGRDHNCDGMVDTTGAGVDWFTDADGDGWGTGTAIHQCMPVPGRVTRGGDCDDSTPARHPGALDVCNGVDDDCNGAVDDTVIQLAFYTDADHDGAGGTTPILACAPPAGASVYPNDCDDANPARYPGAPEICNGLDDNCDGVVDEATSASLCAQPGVASGTCTAGTCVGVTCMASFANCDGSTSNGCEADTRTDPLHCGSCTPCPARAGSTATCAAGVCGLACSAGLGDCDSDPTNGCESPVTSDPLNCGGCAHRCSARPNAAGTCTASACTIACNPGYADCDTMAPTGCEVWTDGDAANCGACGRACAAGDICALGDCFAAPFDRTLATAAFNPTTDTVLPAGRYYYTSIHIPAGVTVRTNGTGVLELFSTGDVTIDGVVDVSGGNGGLGATPPSMTCDTSLGLNGGGGETGSTVAGADGVTLVCHLGGGGGAGGTGGDGFGTPCASGGAHGGGAGGTYGAGRYAGGGGGGYAGGGGACGQSSGGDGGNGGGFAGYGVGGSGGTYTGGVAAHGGDRGLGAPYAGSDSPTTYYGGAGGSIGFAAAADLAVASTFYPGSGGGGATCWGGSGGGGGGGAVRVVSLTRITLTGAIRANGGSSGSTGGAQAGGGGGSGGVIVVSSPELTVTGTLSAVAGVSRAPAGEVGGDGGLGRIRISTIPARCNLTSSVFAPTLVSACAPTPGAGTPGRTYIGVWPL